MKHWKFYPALICFVLGPYFLTEAILTFGTFWHFESLRMSALTFAVSVALWLDYREKKKE